VTLGLFLNFFIRYERKTLEKRWRRAIDVINFSVFDFDFKPLYTKSKYSYVKRHNEIIKGILI